MVMWLPEELLLTISNRKITLADVRWTKCVIIISIFLEEKLFHSLSFPEQNRKKKKYILYTFLEFPFSSIGLFLSMAVCMCLATQSCLTFCDPMYCSPSGSSVHGDSPGKNTGVGCHALLQGIFWTQGSNPGLPHCIRSFTTWATREVETSHYFSLFFFIVLQCTCSLHKFLLAVVLLLSSFLLEHLLFKYLPLSSS